MVKVLPLLIFLPQNQKQFGKLIKLRAKWLVPCYGKDIFMALTGRQEVGQIFQPYFALNASNGKVIWEEKGFGLGTVILVDDTLVVLSRKGELALIEANAEKYSERARFQVLSGKENWIPPTYSNGTAL